MREFLEQVDEAVRLTLAVLTLVGKIAWVQVRMTFWVGIGLTAYWLCGATKRDYDDDIARRLRDAGLT